MNYNIGQIIRSERVKRGLTQEELSFGICTTATLSRIECGLHNPTRAIVKAILDKIGNVDYNFIDVDSKEQSEISLNKEKIAKLLLSDRIANAKALLKKVCVDEKKYDILDKQFLCAANSFIDICEEKYSFATYSDLLKAIHYTITNYKQHEEINYILTLNETFLIMTIAYYHLKTCNTQYAIEMLTNLTRTLAYQIADLGIKDVFYTSAEKQLALCYYNIEEYQQSYTILQHMIAYSREHGYYEEIALVGREKALCELKMGLYSEISKTVFTSYFALKAMKQYDNAEKVKAFALSQMKYQFSIKYI